MKWKPLYNGLGFRDITLQQGESDAEERGKLNGSWGY